MPRFVLLAAMAGLLTGFDAGSFNTASIGVLLLFALPSLVVPFLPSRVLRSERFELALGGFDLLLIGTAVLLSGGPGGFLPVSCSLMLLVVALGQRTAHVAAGAAGVILLHTWYMRQTGDHTSPAHLGSELVFLYCLALHYGVLAGGVHGSLRKRKIDRIGQHEFQALLKILETVASSVDVRHITNAIVTCINAVVPGVRCSLLLINERKRRCHVIASHDDPNVYMMELDLRKYPEVRRAILTKKPVVISDVTSDPVMKEVRAALQDLGIHSIMVIPLTFGEDLIGTLLLKTARVEPDFTRREVDFCVAVARTSANALKNAMLHRQAEEQAARHRRTAEKLGRILNDSPDLILSADQDGCITELSRSGEDLLGYSKEEMIGRPYTSLFPADAHRDLTGRLRTGDVVSNYPCQLARKDGRLLSMELSISTLRSEKGDPFGTVWVARDVTQLKIAQTQLLQAEKLSSIGSAIAGVVHELNNPLSVVIGFSQILTASSHDASIARQLETINEAALRCQRVVKNLLSFARVHKPERRYLGVNGILEKTLDLKKYHLHVSDIEVVRDLDANLPRTMLDFHQMQQVLLNIINNAEQALSAVRSRPRRLTVRTRYEDGLIRLEIGDNGAGMEPETLRRIFDPFFTTKPDEQGTGLGLSVSYGIVKEHGGRIYADSRRGEGSTFVIELPVCGTREESPADPSDARATAGIAEAPGKKRILLVDDEPAILDLLIMILEDPKYLLDTAANGEEACRKVLAQHYDLVITDVRMPRVSGIDLYRTLLAERPEMAGRVIFISGDLMNEETARFFAQVNARTLTKPLDIPRLVKAVEETLAAPAKTVLV